MENEKGSKKLGFVDVIIIGIIIVCLGGAFYVYFLQNDNQTYNYTAYFSNGTNSKTYDILASFNFTATTFSAQNNITVSAIASFTSDYLRQHPEQAVAVKYLNLYFPTSVPPNPQYRGGHVLSEIMTLTKDDYDQNFTGSAHVIVYQTEGEKCVIISTATITQGNSTCPPNSTILTVSAVDSTYQFKTNKVNTVLALVLVAFTVVTIRDFFEKAGHNFALLKRDRTSTPKDETQKPKKK